MTTEFDTMKMRACTYLLPDPGGEVVRSCLDEIERLRELLDSHFGSGWEDWDRASFMVMSKDIDRLKQEVDAERKDAERYRWLRDNPRGRSLSVSALEWRNDPALADVAVDAAMAAAGIGAA